MKRHLRLLTLIFGATVGLVAQSPTSFVDGTWKLNAAKSDGGPRALPGGLSVKITSNGPEFEGLQTADGVETLLKFRSDGREMVNQLPGGAEMKSKHRVENGVLLADYHITFDQGEIKQTDRIVASPDGKILTTDREVKSAQGSYKQKLVFDRQ
ncbi:MAG: hypothetical protein IPP47_13070 [Bryobacterales bacterium]|nr:hypothetical protein [Bryobacterales bacterium]